MKKRRIKTELSWRQDYYFPPILDGPRHVCSSGSSGPVCLSDVPLPSDLRSRPSVNLIDGNPLKLPLLFRSFLNSMPTGSYPLRCHGIDVVAQCLLELRAYPFRRRSTNFPIGISACGGEREGRGLFNVRARDWGDSPSERRAWSVMTYGQCEERSVADPIHSQLFF